jgi:cyclopropane-fatty-acyl-phospholipid synthase
MLIETLGHRILNGSLAVISPSGSVTTFGEKNADQAAAKVVVRVTRWITALKLGLWPDLYLGEAYMNGSLVLERGDLRDLLDICGRNQMQGPSKSGYLGRVLKALLRRFRQRNAGQAARRNVAHHYDLSHTLFEAFLDQDLQYSCAYFRAPGISLDEAQRAKKDHIAAKLLLRPGQRVLDIGCGWGGLALTLAELEDVEVTGVTLSQEQLQIARQRARQRGLARRVQFELCDYRAIEGKFDRIVSVGMLEHVGVPNYGKFFDKVSSLLTDRGIALIHSIGRMRGPDVTSAWIRKYIFPGGYIPALSQIFPAIESAGLWLTDLEILRLHYSETLRLWRQSFLSRKAELAQAYDERFCRLWEFYLAASEMSFRYGGMMVFQAQLSRHIAAVPLTRAYLSNQERSCPPSLLLSDALGTDAASLKAIGTRTHRVEVLSREARQ